jgi:hypothetical protein
MRKCREDEVPAPVIQLAAQCSQGVQFNWVGYLCQEFLDDCRMRPRKMGNPSIMHGCFFDFFDSLENPR